VTQPQLQIAIKDLPFASVGPKPAIFARLQDPLLSTYFALMIPVKKTDSTDSLIALGLLSSANFEKWSDMVKGSDREMIVIDDKGFALALSEPAYVGSALDKHPFVSEVLKNRTLKERSESRDLANQPILAVSEKLENTNLYIIITRPSASFNNFARMLLARTGLDWLAVVALLGLGLWMILRTSNLPMPTVAVASATVPPPPPPLDRSEAYRIVGPGLVHAMRTPLSIILGHAQLAHSKTTDPALREHHEVLEKEARRLRETLESLGRLSGTEMAFEPQKIDLHETIENALLSVNVELQKEKIVVVKNLAPNAYVMAAASPVTQMFIELINNAREALRGCPKKEIRISLQLLNNVWQAEIEDSGTGLTAAEHTHVFEPFFTTKAKEEHAGLGLTMARSLVRGFGADIHFETKKGQGSKVVVAWPLVAEVKAEIKPVDLEVLLPETDVTILHGKEPLDPMRAQMLPDAPKNDLKDDLKIEISNNEEAEEWQQLPRQLHTEDLQLETNTDLDGELRKPKMRVKI
jgi:signal transduction histidine kinase